ncbi:hypothetical protein DPMN_116299 [Dreissena polymorpha]|uniref:Uncharacterized protein n=1 Tax=Dreissena polymorpha TaxID=45954 RepID=A0A9D4K2U1_DREPO|nr:hypothetical protein DPMN_104632 [Dreissena polymorpha]KAH3842672.1 hypothetical protein DPMN_116176 [Dreissena polymorpha]KAH3842795.1 hypothetical protein DPMN_116299 [Dreissena polymorpha]
MAPMNVASAMCVLLFTIGVEEGNCYQCCTSYTDYYGQYHSPETCNEYCCTDLIRNNYKDCCNDRSRQVNSSGMKEGSCESTAEIPKSYVTMLATVIPLAIIGGCCYYCCCKRTTRVTTVTTIERF